MESRVRVLEFMSKSIGFMFQGLGFRVWGLELRVWGSGLKVWGLRFEVWGVPMRPKMSIRSINRFITCHRVQGQDRSLSLSVSLSPSLCPTHTLFLSLSHTNITCERVQGPLLSEKPEQCLAPSQDRAPPSAKLTGSLLPRGGRALVTRLGLGVSKVDWTMTFVFVRMMSMRSINRFITCHRDTCV